MNPEIHLNHPNKIEETIQLVLSKIDYPQEKSELTSGPLEKNV
jgi:hypothetical protein